MASLRVARCLSSLLILVLFSALGFAQDPIIDDPSDAGQDPTLSPQPYQPYTSGSSGPIGVEGYPAFNSTMGEVNPANLDVHLTIPIISKRGVGMDFSYVLPYDSTFWYPYYSSATNSYAWNQASYGGWDAPISASSFTNIQEGITGRVHAAYSILESNHYCHDLYGVYYRDPQGTHHPLPDEHGLGPVAKGCVASFSNYTLDGSGYVYTYSINSNNNTVTDANGNVANLGAVNVTDPNGNKVYQNASGANWVSFADTLGTTVLTVTIYNNAQGYLDHVTYSYTGGGDSAQTITAYYTNKLLVTAFGCTDVQDYGDPYNIYTPLLTSISFPDGSSNSFAYEQTPGHNASYSTGRLTKATLRTGGVVTYQYQNGVNCGTSGANADATPNKVTKGVSTDGSHFNYWTYTRTGTPPSSSITTVQAPSTDTTVINFAYYQEIQRKVFTGTNTSVTPLEQITYCYNFSNYNPCPGPTGPSSGQAQTVPYSISKLRVFNGGNNDNTVTSYGFVPANGRMMLPTEVDYYDFGATSPSRQVVTPYGTYNAANGTCSVPGTNILNRTCYVNVYGPSSQPCSDASSGAPTLCASTWFTYDTSGNLSSKNLNTGWTGTTWHILPTTYTYYGNGALNTVKEPNGTTTTFSSMTCGPTGSPGAFPQTISSSAVSWNTSKTWDCNGGVMLSSKDGNGATTTVGYNDPFWRVTDVYAPWKNSQTTLTHTTYINANSFYSYQNVNGTNSQQQSLTDLDALGRPLVRSTLALGGPYSSVSYQYDSNGRLQSVSNPCLSANYWTPCTGPGTTYSGYDGLDRPEYITDGAGETLTETYSFSNNKYVVLKQLPIVGPNEMSRSFAYDAFGELSSVCELTSTLLDYGQCGYNSWTGYRTDYTYDPVGRLGAIFQNHQDNSGYGEIRAFYYDLAGRLIEEQHPELGAPSVGSALIYYNYDNQSGYCWAASSPGDLVSVTDASLHMTCYLHDGLHRITDAAGWQNSNWYGPCHRYRYDGNSVHGIPTGISVTGSNGRMNEAGTDPCSGTSETTDEWFSYADSGQMTDMYQSSPNSGGYIHTTASYYENGTINTLSGVPSLTQAWTFGLNADAQINTVADNSGNVVTGINYNAAGQVDGSPAVTFVNGSDAFGHDGAMRMNSFAYTIAGKTYSGSVGWNADGTVGTSSVSDPFYSTSESCSYDYDSLMRMTDVKCANGTTNVWGQTFGYDTGMNSSAFGNLSKSTISGYPGQSFAVTYNTKNQINGFTYDNNGNITNDTVRNYTWDANWHHMTQLGSATMTYDALGRMVESNSKPILYSPVGRIAKLAVGGSYTSADIPTPAGRLYYTPGSTYASVLHPDWLGSSRFMSRPYKNVAVSATGYAPFGETYNTASAMQLDFTDQFNDAPSVNNIYDFPFRKLANVQGRWFSPDPTNGPLTDPQTFNKYSYVRNGPMGNRDPLGLQSGDSPCPHGCPQPEIANVEQVDFLSGDSIVDDLGKANAPRANNTGFLIRRVVCGSATCKFWKDFAIVAMGMNQPIDNNSWGVTMNDLLSVQGLALSWAGGFELAALGSSLDAVSVTGTSVASNSDWSGSLADLNNSLRLQEAQSIFTEDGGLNQGTIDSSRMIIPAEDIGNPDVPAGFAKYTTPSFQSPSGDFQVHFYMNPDTGAVYYGTDYKAIFNPQ